jgi:hypothetical protein
MEYKPVKAGILLHEMSAVVGPMRMHVKCWTKSPVRARAILPIVRACLNRYPVTRIQSAYTGGLPGFMTSDNQVNWSSNVELSDRFVFGRT